MGKKLKLEKLKPKLVPTFDPNFDPLQCPHVEVAEADYEKSFSGFFDSLPPFRICESCGVEEDGGGFGYHVLDDAPGRKVRNVSRNAAFDLRKTKLALQDVRQQVDWCYGNKNNPGHAVMKKDLTHNNGTRCSKAHSLKNTETY